VTLRTWWQLSCDAFVGGLAASTLCNNQEALSNLPIDYLVQKYEQMLTDKHCPYVTVQCATQSPASDAMVWLILSFCLTICGSPNDISEAHDLTLTGVYGLKKMKYEKSPNTSGMRMLQVKTTWRSCDKTFLGVLDDVSTNIPVWIRQRPMSWWNYIIHKVVHLTHWSCATVLISWCLTLTKTLTIFKTGWFTEFYGIFQHN